MTAMHADIKYNHIIASMILRGDGRDAQYTINIHNTQLYNLSDLLYNLSEDECSSLVLSEKPWQ